MSEPTLKSQKRSFQFPRWKLYGVLIGGLAGAIFGGKAMVWFHDRPEFWKVTLSIPESTIGAVAGVLLGGTLAGGRTGVFGRCLLLGTVAGFVFGSILQPGSKGLFFGGALAGLLIGLIAGTYWEVKLSRTQSQG